MYFWTLIVSILIFAALEAHAIVIDSHYKYDVIMCAGLLLLAYYLRNPLYIRRIHFVLIAAFLMFHAIGVFSLYETYPFGIEYDYWVHWLFGFVASLVTINALASVTTLNMRVLSVVTIVAILGFAAAHELYEFAGAVLLGKGDGVLFIGAGDLDQWDTQKDILNNLIGGIAGIIVWLPFLNSSRNLTSENANPILRSVSQ